MEKFELMQGRLEELCSKIPDQEVANELRIVHVHLFTEVAKREKDIRKEHKKEIKTLKKEVDRK